MYGIASTTSEIVLMFSGTGALIAFAITGILTSGVALLGLGFAYNSVEKHITGKGWNYNPSPRDNVDWDELDRRANGFLEHDAR